MISLHLARQLKKAGLAWHANIHDFFAIPDRGFDDRVFVISDLQSSLDIFRGWPVVTFHGSAEWALDYILTTEVVWLPGDEQLRGALISQLGSDETAELILNYNAEVFSCAICSHGEWYKFEDPKGSDAYGKALLFLLERSDIPV